MSFAYALGVLAALAVFAGLVLIKDRRRGALIGQIGTGLGAVLLFAAQAQAPDPQAGAARLPNLLLAGVGILSAATGAMGYHLFLGRFASRWAARGAFLCVAIGLAVALGAVLRFLS